MFKPIPVSIGLRYLRAKRRNGFISFISLASILGIALGVTVLITTLSVMSGFQREIRDRMLQMTAHATVSAAGDAMQDWPHAVAVAKQAPRVEGAAPYVDIQALIEGVRNQPAMIRGVIPAEEKKVSVLAEKMKRGSVESLTPGSFNIVLGQELAVWLGVSTGDSALSNWNHSALSPPSFTGASACSSVSPRIRSTARPLGPCAVSDGVMNTQPGW